MCSFSRILPQDNLENVVIFMYFLQLFSRKLSGKCEHEYFPFNPIYITQNLENPAATSTVF
jgi:hypothetical protein